MDTDIYVLCNFIREGVRKNAIEDCCKAGVTKEKLERYLKQPYSDWQLLYICKGLEEGIDVTLYDNPKLKPIQMQACMEGLKKGLTKEQVAIYAKPEFNWIQMEKIKAGLLDGLTEEQVAIYAKPEFNSEQMQSLLLILKEGVSLEQVALCAKPEFDWRQMMIIGNGLLNGLNEEQIAIYAKPEIDFQQMDRMLEEIVEAQKK